MTDPAAHPSPGSGTSPQERDDLLTSLRHHRFLLRNTARELTDEQAALTPTVSQLCVGGLIKHVTFMERRWAAFIVEGTSVFPPADDPAGQEWFAEGFRFRPGDSLAAVLAAYDETAGRTDEVVRTVPDLDAGHPLPERPWFTPGERWSVRRVLLHVIGETAQHAGHAGHADIIRESIDGAKSMG
ncbi:DinB family protein [Plantactinospora sp. KBS50]|uniref:DinB family protein n=1 Tax=Plantactinospora sp. KBS50 TaxID=2024580 RepID=UPI000BAB0080|nr:DinB family protein [Plantactinospora sp. KBS50]ASW55839.1 hypothetical protein CIK06_19200 [Plantactinospora sp. KBS50]